MARSSRRWSWGCVMGDDFKFELDTEGIDNLLARMDGIADRWLAGVAEAIVTDVKLSFGSSPDGRRYTRGSIEHVASQGGYPPNVDLGTLRASIRQQKIHAHERWISDGVEYGVYLEIGTERIAPRPFMRPAFDRIIKEVLGGAGDALARELMQ